MCVCVLGACVENVIFPASCVNEFMLSCMCSSSRATDKECLRLRIILQSFFFFVCLHFGQVKTGAKCIKRNFHSKLTGWRNCVVDGGGGGGVRKS